MNTLACEGVHLAVDIAGHGAPLVLVHGTWTDRTTWNSVFGALADHFRVIRYDRRGYGESDRPGANVDVHTTDLLALIRTLGLTRVTVVGNSLGALIAIRAALRDAELVAKVVAHEPPLEFINREVPLRPLSREARDGLREALDAARSGDATLAAKTFFERVSSSPGTWKYLPENVRRAFVENAPAFLSEVDSVNSFCPDPRTVSRLADRLVVTCGERSSPYLKILTDELCRAVPMARHHVFSRAGHAPHQSGPSDFVAKTLSLLKEGLSGHAMSGSALCQQGPGTL